MEDAMSPDVACKVHVMPRYWKVTLSNVIYATVFNVDFSERRLCFAMSG